jgi:hypothetical protein
MDVWIKKMLYIYIYIVYIYIYYTLYIYIYNGVLFSHEERNYVIYMRTDGTGDHYVKRLPRQASGRMPA